MANTRAQQPTHVEYEIVSAGYEAELSPGHTYEATVTRVRWRNDNTLVITIDLSRSLGVAPRE